MLYVCEVGPHVCEEAVHLHHESPLVFGALPGMCCIKGWRVE